MSLQRTGSLITYERPSMVNSTLSYGKYEHGRRDTYRSSYSEKDRRYYRENGLESTDYILRRSNYDSDRGIITENSRKGKSYNSVLNLLRLDRERDRERSREREREREREKERERERELSRDRGYKSSSGKFQLSVLKRLFDSKKSSTSTQPRTDNAHYLGSTSYVNGYSSSLEHHNRPYSSTKRDLVHEDPGQLSLKTKRTSYTPDLRRGEKQYSSCRYSGEYRRPSTEDTGLQRYGSLYHRLTSKSDSKPQTTTLRSYGSVDNVRIESAYTSASGKSVKILGANFKQVGGGGKGTLNTSNSTPETKKKGFKKTTVEEVLVEQDESPIAHEAPSEQNQEKNVSHEELKIQQNSVNVSQECPAVVNNSSRIKQRDNNVLRRTQSVRETRSSKPLESLSELKRHRSRRQSTDRVSSESITEQVDKQSGGRPAIIQEPRIEEITVQGRLVQEQDFQNRGVEEQPVQEYEVQEQEVEYTLRGPTPASFFGVQFPRTGFTIFNKGAFERLREVTYLAKYENTFTGTIPEVQLEIQKKAEIKRNLKIRKMTIDKRKQEVESVNIIESENKLDNTYLNISKVTKPALENRNIDTSLSHSEMKEISVSGEDEQNLKSFPIEETYSSETLKRSESTIRHRRRKTLPLASRNGSQDTEKGLISSSSLQNLDAFPNVNTESPLGVQARSDSNNSLQNLKTSPNGEAKVSPHQRKSSESNTKLQKLKSLPIENTNGLSEGLKSLPIEGTKCSSGVGKISEGLKPLGIGSTKASTGGDLKTIPIESTSDLSEWKLSSHIPSGKVPVKRLELDSRLLLLKPVIRKGEHEHEEKRSSSDRRLSSSSSYRYSEQDDEGIVVMKGEVDEIMNRLGAVEKDFSSVNSKIEALKNSLSQTIHGFH